MPNLLLNTNTEPIVTTFNGYPLNLEQQQKANPAVDPLKILTNYYKPAGAPQPVIIPEIKLPGQKDFDEIAGASEIANNLLPESTMPIFMQRWNKVLKQMENSSNKGITEDRVSAHFDNKGIPTFGYGTTENDLKEFAKESKEIDDIYKTWKGSAVNIKDRYFTKKDYDRYIQLTSDLRIKRARGIITRNLKNAYQRMIKRNKNAKLYSFDDLSDAGKELFMDLLYQGLNPSELIVKKDKQGNIIESRLGGGQIYNDIVTGDMQHLSNFIEEYYNRIAGKNIERNKYRKGLIEALIPFYNNQNKKAYGGQLEILNNLYNFSDGLKLY